MTVARLTPCAAAIALLASLSFNALAIDATKTPALTPSSWQARLQLSSLEPAPAGLYEAQSYSGSRLLSANLLGDYYLTGSGLSGVQGGLRATGGLMLGSLSQSSAGLALGASSSGQAWSVGQRSISLLAPLGDGNDPYGSMSYLGIGYTGQSLRGGWGFSADLGLVNGSATSGLRLGTSRSQGMEDLLRDIRFRPVLQLGLSYSY
ncbi:hypothetical protein [Roseateles oligotrophus]|uniref:Outer membrane protein beta-barrel domain-containing protein n=1 Tax=Roseateles oligotrophus TaxID=1769250 RepID=A0ABT2YIS8_9BURK|nr:hypothetical protein [Roseateles oligotrophus]MCV2369971.1 hypothetical protein [Roseateles oligotrophus]